LCFFCLLPVSCVLFFFVLCLVFCLSSSCVLFFVCLRPVSCVLFVFVLCLVSCLSSSCVLCFVCLRPVSCVSDVVNILDCPSLISPSIFSDVYFYFYFWYLLWLVNCWHCRFIFSSLSSLCFNSLWLHWRDVPFVVDRIFNHHWLRRVWRYQRGIIILKSKTERQHDCQKKYDKKDKQRFTKYYTKN
jgi:hypothetical protein